VICPFKITYPTPPIFPARAVPPALPTPPLRRNPEPISRRAQFPPQQYDQTQRGERAEIGQVYNMTAEESGEAAVEYEAQYPEQEP